MNDLRRWIDILSEDGMINDPRHDLRRWMALCEGIVGPYAGNGSLWHGTDLLGLTAIIASDLLTKSIDTDNPSGASLTYDERMAWGFADRSSHIFMTNHYQHLENWPHGEPPLTGGVLELDVNRLRHSYKLVLYRDDEQDDEKEVRVLGDQIAPVSRYMISFRFNPQDVAWYTAYLRTPYAHYEGWRDPEGMAQLLSSLPRHPKFRPI